MFDKIKDFLRSIRRFFNKIKRVIDFIPIVWSGYDWDYNYAIDLFKYQLSRMSKHLESDDAHTVNAKEDAMRIRTAIKLMDRVFDDYYSMEYLDYLEEKYGKINYKFEPSEHEGLFEIKTYYGEEGKYSKEEMKKIKEEESKLFFESMKKQEKAERILWKLINHNIRGWWD